MRLQTLLTTSSALAALAFLPTTLTAGTAVISFEGTLSDFMAPEGASFLDRQVLNRLETETYSGKIIIYDFDRFVEFNRSDRSTTISDAVLSFDGDDAVGLVINSATLGGLEGDRSMVANPEFDPSLPVCGIRDNRSGKCEPFNSRTIFAHGVDDDGILGDATLTITAGLPTRFEWVSPRDVMASFDRFFEANNLNIRLTQATMTIDRFAFEGAEGEFVYFNAVDPVSTLSLVIED